MLAEALHLLRTRQGLTQVAASRYEGAPDFRTLSHWEPRRKLPSLRLFDGYLRSQGLDFHDLQDALDEVNATPHGRLRPTVERVERHLGEFERRLQRLEGLVSEARQQGLSASTEDPEP